MSTTGLVIVSERCPYCQKGVPPVDMVRMGTQGVRMCITCWERNEPVLRACTEGTPPQHCQECNTAFRELAPMDDLGNVPMVLAFKDGVYQLLCVPCGDAYARKKRELFAGTQYGHQHKL